MAPALLAAAFLAAGCVDGATSQSPVAPTASLSPTNAASGGRGLSAGPGRPYSPASIVELMRGSRRPGGIPEQLMAAGVAQAVAGAIWTWDGAPWQTVSISAGCGPESCSLEVAGVPDGSTESDLYLFTMDVASSTVRVVAADLHGMPSELWVELDEFARADLPPETLRGLALSSVRWFPPPDDDRFLLAYRSGGEEGSRGLDLKVDRSTGVVVELYEPGTLP